MFKVLSYRRNIAGLALVAAAVALGLGWSAAGRAITLSPPSLEYSVKPGDVVATKIKLYNESDTPLTLYAQTSNFTAGDEEGAPAFDFGAAPVDAASWIKITKDPIVLNPKDRTEVAVSIQVPADAEPGGHYASIFFGNQATTPAQGGQVAVQSLTGTLVIMRVAGQVREEGRVAEFKVDGSDKQSHLPVKFVLRIQNSGNVHFRPKGFVTIRNMFGGVSQTIPINTKEGAVLPDSVRRFEMVWQRTSDEPATGFFSRIQNQYRNFALGTYTAEAVVAYGEENKTLTANTKVTVIPWELIGIFVVLLAVVIILLVLGIRRYNAMIVRRAAQQSGPNKPTGKTTG